MVLRCRPSTSKMSSTRRPTISRVIFPLGSDRNALGDRGGAKVGVVPPLDGQGTSTESEWFSTPMISHIRLQCMAAVAMPPMRPPPPMAMASVSNSGCWPAFQRNGAPPRNDFFIVMRVHKHQCVAAKQCPAHAPWPSSNDLAVQHHLAP